MTIVDIGQQVPTVLFRPRKEPFFDRIVIVVGDASTDILVPKSGPFRPLSRLNALTKVDVVVPMNMAYTFLSVALMR